MPACTAIASYSGGGRRAPGGGETPRHDDAGDRHHGEWAADPSEDIEDLVSELSDQEIEGEHLISAL